MAVHLEKALEDDLACPICSDSLEDPVLLNCGHNFCQACITRVWEGLEENFSCPKCGKRFQERHLLPNPLLGKMVERARQLGWGAEGSMCQRHQERLKLYCQEDQALICLVCVRSKEHRAHRVVHIEEAAQEYKGQFQRHLQILKDESSCQEAFTISEGRRLETLLAHTKAEKQRVVSTFQRLYWLLQEKERLLLKGLGNVAQGVKQLQRENISRLHQRATLLHGLVVELEGKCRLPAAVLLKDAESTLNKYKKMKLPELASAPTAELEESIRHHSRKRRALQDEMWESREILTLDAASAHPGLVVSPDRHSVWHGNSGGCPPSDHRRFFPASCILGSEGFSSGRHRWEVEVGDKDGWAVGVARESVRRRDPMELQPQHGVWAVELGWYQLLPLSPWPPAAAPSQRPHRIQVCLDYEGGRVSFYDAENLTPLFTFTASFTETLFPFFWLWAPSARITLCP
ncbi:E3 ubiquitin-protein ligase TRIM39-like [Chelonoidis abingdonii]|uniref:E3 ubiquitin-protein ligase TRIM39-like n=1 Tax=Chelonoidis abingdonii TaxID=106734 RepID=UPI0013F21A23|nr:E3 ubiquitin-protein ligase TRIM39-like isoform X1 [Chelonoidis abingdonii]